LQKVTPDIKTAALYRVDKQGFAGQIVRRNPRFHRQRVIRRQHQPHFKIKHRRIVQATARQNIRGHHQIQFTLLKSGLRIKSDARFKVHFNLRPILTEVLQRGR